MTRAVILTPDQQSGKAGFKALVKAYGGQEAVAAEFGLRQQKISDMGLPNVAEFATIDLIDALEDRTHGTAGWPLVTNWLCRRRGGVFVHLPQGSEDGDGLMRTVIEMAGDLGDVSDAVAHALSPSSEAGEQVSRVEALAALERLAALDGTSARLRRSLTHIIDNHASKHRGERS